jgi:hypothetical protein
MEPGAWWYNRANLPLGDINTETWSSRLEVGHKADDLALQENYCYEIQRSENRMVQFKTSLAESSKEGYVSKTISLMMMMMTKLMMVFIDFKNLLCIA